MKSTFKIPLLIAAFVTALFAATPAQAQQTKTNDVLLGKWTNEDKDRTIEFTKKGTEYIATIVAAEDKSLIGKQQITGLQWDGKTFKNGTLHVIKKGKTFACSVTVKDNNTIEISGKSGLISKSQAWTKIK